MKTLILTLTTPLSSLSLNACVITADDESIFTVDNQSDFAIHEVYLAEIGSPSWGPELLVGDILYPGEYLEVQHVECGTYDALVYDELGAECEIHNLDLCLTDIDWVINNALLSTCPVVR